MTVRRATRRDLKGILELSKELDSDGDAFLDAGIIEDYLHGEIVYCIEDAGDIFGVLLLEQNADGSIHIGRLYVHPEYRDQGYGSDLMERFIEDDLDPVATKAFLSIDQDHPAIRFYERFGFRETTMFKPPREDQIAMMRLPKAQALTPELTA